ncbi:hypothetical protein D5086_001052 [Populus alba]|nr:uncharacterized protein LOC118036069 [Populus alba]XP_034897664.1 uncharacterized protein LOC118036069 [Populus alba]
MQGGRGNRDPFFDNGDPFGGFGGFGGQRSLLSDFFGGRDPFDDPFFTRPFGGMLESNFFGSGGNPFVNMHPSPFPNMLPSPFPNIHPSPFPNMLPSPFPNMHPSPFPNLHPSGFVDHQAPELKKSRGPIIEELDSDNEKGEGDTEKKENPRKHGRSSKEPYVEDPDDEAEARKSKHLQYSNDYSSFNGMESLPQGHSFTFQSSTVTHGGANGAYYTSSKTRRAGSDGLTFEESKAADSATGQATHKVSRGLHNKGHSLTRKLNSDGRVNTMQMLHNLNEDELTGFEEAWKGNAGKHLPGWTGSFTGIDNIGASRSGQNAQASRGGWALPSAEQSQHSGRMVPDTTVGAGSSGKQQSGRRKGSSDVKDMVGYPKKQ